MARSHRKKKHRLLKALLTLVLLIGLVLLGGRLYFRLPVRDYYAASERAFTIPGLNEGFIPQGLAQDDANSIWLVGGYMKGGSASPIYCVDKASGAVTKATLADIDGQPFTGHAGGLALSGDRVLVAGSECLLVYDAAAVRAGGQVRCLNKLGVSLGEGDPLGVAYVNVDADGIVTVGEFYRDPNYPTAETHKFTTQSGERLQALAVRYFLAGDTLIPVDAYALPDLVQGMTFTEDSIWLSTSWGTAFSGIGRYPREGLEQVGTVLDGVPVYALSGSARTAQYKLPPMAEEIVFTQDGKLVTMCESASHKYWFGLLTGGQFCYMTDLNKMSPR